MYLNCHSYYSLRYGTMAVETLVEEAARLGIESLVLTDINNSMGMVDFVRVCHKHGIQPIAGIEYRNGDKFLYTGIAQNPHGFRELNDFLSYHNETGLPLPERDLHWTTCGLSTILMTVSGGGNESCVTRS